MPKIFLLLRTCLLYFFGLCILLVTALPLAVLLALTPEKKRWNSTMIFSLLGLLYWLLVKCSLIKLTVTYEEKSLITNGSVWIANHQSAFDIPLLGYLQHAHSHFWFFWARFLSTPVLGFFVHRLGVPVTQRSSSQDAGALLQAVKLLKEYQCNALLFPEGGRFSDGKVRPFSGGYLVLARKAGVPIVPVFMRGVASIYPPYSFYLYPGSVSIAVGRPIAVSEHETDEQVMELVAAWYRDHEG